MLEVDFVLDIFDMAIDFDDAEVIDTVDAVDFIESVDEDVCVVVVLEVVCELLVVVVVAIVVAIVVELEGVELEGALPWVLLGALLIDPLPSVAVAQPPSPVESSGGVQRKLVAWLSKKRPISVSEDAAVP